MTETPEHEPPDEPDLDEVMFPDSAARRAAGNLWENERAQVAAILDQVRNLRRALADPTAATGPPPEAQTAEDIANDDADAAPVVMDLTAVDPETGDCYLYEIVDRDGRPFEHPCFELDGHRLRLRPGAAARADEGGSTTLYLLVTNAAGDARIEEYAVRLRDAIAGGGGPAPATGFENGAESPPQSPQISENS